MKARLENEDIMCFLYDEYILSLDPFYNLSVGGIKLKIEKSDSEKTLKIVTAYNQAQYTNTEGEIINCPHCQSSEICISYKSMRGYKGFFVAIISFVFFVFPIFYRTINKCKMCGYEFKKI